MFLLPRSPVLIHLFIFLPFPGFHWMNTCQRPLSSSSAPGQGCSVMVSALSTQASGGTAASQRVTTGGEGGRPDRGAGGQGPQRSTFVNCRLPNYSNMQWLKPIAVVYFLPGFLWVSIHTGRGGDRSTRSCPGGPAARMT